MNVRHNELSGTARQMAVCAWRQHCSDCPYADGCGMYFKAAYALPYGSPLGELMKQIADYIEGLEGKPNDGQTSGKI